MSKRRCFLFVLPLVSAFVAFSAQATHATLDPSKAASSETAFLRSYWKLPIPPQGSPPPEFHPLARSLHPQNCAVCHPRQFADWRTSLHAHAMGPGVTGQLVDFLKHGPNGARSCESCHAPLSEQQENLADDTGVLRRNPHFEATLQSSAVSCAACHVRNFKRNGPPRDPDRPSGITWAGLPVKPHGDVFRTPYFERSQFCASCHQFDPGNEVNGKPLENTVQEWRSSVYGRQGISCQQCHMPERRHLWRGIHDPAMVKQGVTIDFKAPAGGRRTDRSVTATLRLTNSGVGHDFPTYVTPDVVVRIEQQDAAGRSLPSTRSEWQIGRAIDFTDDGPRERWDTRITAGSSRDFSYRRHLAPTAARLRAWVQVYPDHYYTGFYHQVLARTDRSTESERLLRDALQHSQQTSYMLFDRIRDLGHRR